MPDWLSPDLYLQTTKVQPCVGKRGKKVSETNRSPNDRYGFLSHFGILYLLRDSRLYWSFWYANLPASCTYLSVKFCPRMHRTNPLKVDQPGAKRTSTKMRGLFSTRDPASARVNLIYPDMAVASLNNGVDACVAGGEGSAPVNLQQTWLSGYLQRACDTSGQFLEACQVIRYLHIFPP